MAGSRLIKLAYKLLHQSQYIVWGMHCGSKVSQSVHMNVFQHESSFPFTRKTPGDIQAVWMRGTLVIVNRGKLHCLPVSPRPICVWQKHGEICLFLSFSHQDITIPMDIQIQPGPWSQIPKSTGLSQSLQQSQPIQATPMQHNRQFSQLSENYMRKLIKLDPMTTPLFVNCIDSLLPVITKTINLSLSIGYFQSTYRKQHNTETALFKSNEWYTAENELTACYSTSYTVKGFNPGVFLKVGLGWVWSSGRTQSWIGLLLLTVTGVSTTCAVVIFRVKVSCITSFDGIILRLLIWLVNYVAMLSVASFWTKANHTMVIPRTSDEWHIPTQLQIAP